jgi:uncharacterized cofD-like protein
MNGHGPLPTERRRGSIARWLKPGIGVKRWLAVVLLGELLIALGLALVIRQVYRDLPETDPASGLLDLLSLQFLPLELRPLVLLALGLAIFVLGAWRLFRALISPFRLRDEPLVEMLFQRRVWARGPHIVTIGGGTGLSALLRGLKELTSNITAVVTVADDGGSSGKLREELGVPPMGDIRNCIAALADAEPAMTRLLQYRFPKGDAESGNGLEGHSFGNLLIAAMADIEGDFEEAVRQSNRVLAVRGKVVPAAPEPVTLHAELEDGSILEGQSHIARARGIRRVWITPESVRACDEAVEAIGAAELVVLGPGSLYTSLIPNLMVPGIRQALERSAAPRLYVCNVATQVGETEGYTLADHLAALRAHGLDELVDAVLANNNFSARAPQRYPAAPVKVDLPLRAGSRPLVILRDVVDDDNAHRHHPGKLAAAILSLHEDRVLRRTPTAQPA